MEIGWLVCDNLDDVDQQAIDHACDEVAAYLREVLPEFDWRISVAKRESPVAATLAEPTEYLDWATAQRDLWGWDHVIVFIEPDLQTQQKPQAWACISRSLDSAVISTARIDPRADDPNSESRQRQAALSRRVKTLALRCLGHLWGLSPVEVDDNVMRPVDDVSQLDTASFFSDPQLATLQDNLQRIADLRLEEEQQARRLPWWNFYPRAAWRNRREIVAGIRQARPWQMPARLSRLTLAALSTVLVLIMTAEAWELSGHQTAGQVVGLSVVAVIATVVYVLVRQRLLLRRQQSRLSEQVVTTNLTTIGIIGTGILTMYACLFALTLLIGMALFDASLVASWSASRPATIGWDEYCTFAAVVSSAGIVIGAMGASFEGQHYFRHITYVDEEV